MINPLGRFIRARRKQLQISQLKLAEMLNVCRIVVLEWEHGQRPVPFDHYSKLANLLNCTEEYLRALGTGVQASRLLLESNVATLRPLACTVDQMLAVNPTAQIVQSIVKSRLSAGEYGDFLDCFLRDTEWEFLLAHQILCDTASLQWLSPLLEGCRLFITDDDKQAYGGDLLRLSIVWERDSERMTFTPQVPIIALKNGQRYRVDYLVLHTQPGSKPVALALELDGAPHENHTVRDKERSDALSIPVIRFDNRALLRPEFLQWLFREVRRQTESRRITEPEYQRFLKRKQEKLDNQRLTTKFR